MIGSKLPSSPALPLKPFALRIREGYLLGTAADGEHASPCATCVANWLSDRNVKAEPTPEASLPAPARAALNKLMVDAIPHRFLEVMDNGQKNRLDCMVFPHPRCRCRRENFVPVPPKTKNLNLAFSPIFQLKCVRYGTPSGNLWFFTAMGQAPITMRIIASHGADPDKECARQKALSRWMKKATLAELDLRVQTGETFPARELGIPGEFSIARLDETADERRILGAGDDDRSAVADALIQLAKEDTIEEYSRLGKNPMLIVGSNNWIRGKVPFFLIQQYDLYPLFYPNKSPAWVVGLAAFSRLHSEDKPIFAFGADRDITSALDQAIHQVLEHCRPVDWRSRQNRKPDEENRQRAMKLNSWWTHWVYRCPKIGLKDVLQLEPHSGDELAWRAHLGERGTSLRLVNVNSALMPRALRHLVKADLTTIGDRPYTRASNVRGIATWASVRSAVNPLQ